MVGNLAKTLGIPKLARNTAANSNENDNDDQSQAEPLHLLTMFGDAPRNPGNFSLPANFNAKAMAWYWRKYERGKFVTTIKKHAKRKLVTRLD